MNSSAFLALAITFTLLLATTAGSAEQRKEFSATITKQVGTHYLVVTPTDFTPQEKYPLLIFLHGRGEQGEDLDRVKIHGPFEKIQELELPFIIAAPQSPLDQWWDVDTLSAWTDELLKTMPVDRNRIYLTGLSMGGFGTWDLAVHRPDLFAAIVPICGRGQPSQAARLRNLPVWAFHGEKDTVVPLRETLEMVNALYEVGNNARLTVYPDTGHNSWTETYNNPQVYEWLLGHEKSTSGKTD